jgi:hypothetical protein
MTTKLRIWTVYDHPRDYPDTYVACLHVVEAGGSRPTDEIIRSTDLEALRAEMLRRGLFCSPRQPGDDVKIIESWL